MITFFDTLVASWPITSPSIIRLQFHMPIAIPIVTITVFSIDIAVFSLVIVAFSIFTILTSFSVFSILPVPILILSIRLLSLLLV